MHRIQQNVSFLKLNGNQWRNMKEHPDSPFLWKKNKAPTVFVLDPHFRSKQKAGLLEDAEGLGYKQFGTFSRAATPSPNKHVGFLKSASKPVVQSAKT
tara:strand:- start:1997 stop:2290 length:294 start_codon:yes stop_codon:yes gene_type:complete